MFMPHDCVINTYNFLFLISDLNFSKLKKISKIIVFFYISVFYISESVSQTRSEKDKYFTLFTGLNPIKLKILKMTGKMPLSQ